MNDLPGAPEQVHWYLWASSLAVQEPGNSLDSPRPRMSPPPASVCTSALTSGETLRDYFKPKAPTNERLTPSPDLLSPVQKQVWARICVCHRRLEFPAARRRTSRVMRIKSPVWNIVDFLQGSIVALLVSAWHRRRMKAHITEPTRQNWGHD